MKTTKCKRCGIQKRGEFNQFQTCRNTEACKRRAAIKSKQGDSAK